MSFCQIVYKIRNINRIINTSAKQTASDKRFTSKKYTMRKLFILFSVFMCFNVYGQQARKKAIKPAAVATQQQLLKIVDFDELKTIINKKDDKLYLVNFWATWCKPCVAELPGFMEVNKTYRNNPHFKMILVSMDMAKDLNTAVKTFITKNNITPDVYLLDDNKRMNEWIPTIDTNWSGAIPATVFYRNGEKLEFIENVVEKEELVKLINRHL